MSGELLLVNPRGRRKGSRRRLPPRHKSGPNKGKFMKRGSSSGTHRRRRRASTHRRRGIGRRVATVRLARRRRGRKTRTIRVYANPRRRRRNPIGLGGMFGNVTHQLAGAAKGAAGALAVNAIYNYVPLPAMLRTGYVGLATKVGIAMLLGTFGRRLPVIGGMAAEMSRGSLTVIATQVLSGLLANTGLRLGDASYSGIGYYSPAEIVDGMGGVGEYLSGDGYNPGDMEQQEMGEYV